MTGKVSKFASRERSSHNTLLARKEIAALVDTFSHNMTKETRSCHKLKVLVFAVMHFFLFFYCFCPFLFFFFYTLLLFFLIWY